MKIEDVTPEETVNLVKHLINEVELCGKLKTSFEKVNKDYTNIKKEHAKMYSTIISLENHIATLKRNFDCEICNICDGHGGQDFGDDFGNGYYQVCEKCEGTGIIKNKTNDSRDSTSTV